jgi:hypothetical protein
MELGQYFQQKPCSRALHALQLIKGTKNPIKRDGRTRSSFAVLRPQLYEFHDWLT